MKSLIHTGTKLKLPKFLSKEIFEEIVASKNLKYIRQVIASVKNLVHDLKDNVFYWENAEPTGNGVFY